MKNDNKNLMIVLIVVIILLLFRGFGFGMMGIYGNGFMLLNWLFNILIIVLVVLGIYWLIKKINSNERRRR